MKAKLEEIISMQTDLGKWYSALMQETNADSFKKQ